MNREKQKVANYDQHWNYALTNVQSDGGRSGSGARDTALFTKYLEFFWKRDGDLKKFEELLDNSWLKTLHEEFTFLAGKETQLERVDASKFESLARKVLIEFCESNTEYFAKEDAVCLHVDLKNVPTLHIKIFEFNTENYYRKNLAPFRTDINLDGLIASEEKVFHFDVAPQLKFRETFELK